MLTTVSYKEQTEPPVQTYAEEENEVILNEDIIVKQHPINRAKYLLNTDAIMELHDMMLEKIDIGTQGVIVYGSAFVGKSHAMRAIEKSFKDKMSDKFVTVRLVLANRNYSYREFFQHFAEKIGGPKVSKTASNERLISNIVSRLVHMARQHNDTIVLILDEADSLQVSHYSHVKHLYNLLEDEGVKMCTFLVGTNELVENRNAFKEEGDAGDQIVRRFMQETYHFSGIKNIEELHYIMSGYDTQVYEGRTFTEFFFPEAYAKGARFADMAGEMLAAMLEVSGLRNIPEVPMGEFTRLVNAVFVFFGKYSTKTDGLGHSLKRDWIGKEEFKKVMLMLKFDEKLAELYVGGSKSREEEVLR